MRLRSLRSFGLRINRPMIVTHNDGVEPGQALRFNQEVAATAAALSRLQRACTGNDSRGAAVHGA